MRLLIKVQAFRKNQYRGGADREVELTASPEFLRATIAALTQEIVKAAEECITEIEQEEFTNAK